MAHGKSSTAARTSYRLTSNRVVQQFADGLDAEYQKHAAAATTDKGMFISHKKVKGPFHLALQRSAVSGIQGQGSEWLASTVRDSARGQSSCGGAPSSVPRETLSSASHCASRTLSTRTVDSRALDWGALAASAIVR